MNTQDLMTLGVAMARAHAGVEPELQDLLTPHQLVELAVTSASERLRRKAVLALVAQTRAHALRDAAKVLA